MTKIRRPVIDDAKSQRQAVAHLTKAYDLLSVPVHIADPNGNIIYINQAGVVRSGFSMEECIGHNPGDLWGGNESKEFYREMWDSIKQRDVPFKGQVTNKMKDGSLYKQTIFISPVFDALNDPTYFISVQTDID